MRLRAINIYSAFLGDLEKTKERTALIRKESDFLYLEYYNVVRFCNNEFIKQLNVSCDENAKEIAVRERNSDGQIFVDSEVLRLCSPLVPFQTGMLDKSGKLGTEIGSGEVRYIAPYAAAQYYNTAESRPYDSQRGAKWFERMKVGHKKEILIGARKIAGGG